MTARKVARQLTGQRGALRIRQGTVTAVAADRTVSVQLGGSATTLTGIACLTGAVPRSGSSVLLLGDGRDLFVLGSVADDTDLGYTPLLQFGAVDVTLSAASTATASVTFGWSFPSAPLVLVSTQRGASKSYVATANSVTVSGFTARASVLDGTSQSETVEIRWVALHDGD